MVYCMAIELFQYIIQRRFQQKGWWVSLAPTSQPGNNYAWHGPYKNCKEARIAVDKLDPSANWANSKKAYTKIDVEVPW